MSRKKDLTSFVMSNCYLKMRDEKQICPVLVLKLRDGRAYSVVALRLSDVSGLWFSEELILKEGRELRFDYGGVK